MPDEKQEPKVEAYEEPKAAGWVESAKKPIVAPDGHVVLSQEDIDRRKEEGI